MSEDHSGFKLLGNIDGSSNTYKCENMLDPTVAQDYVTLNYLDTNFYSIADDKYLSNTGDTGTGDYTFNGNITANKIATTTTNGDSLTLTNPTAGRQKIILGNTSTWAVLGVGDYFSGNINRLDINADSIFLNGITYPAGDMTESRKGDSISTGTQKESYKWGMQNSMWNGSSSYLAYNYMYGFPDTTVNERRGIKFTTTTTASNIVYGNGNLILWNDGYMDLPNDNEAIRFGAGQDASIAYDGTNLVINPKLVGTGFLSILGDISLLNEDIILSATTGTKMGTATTQKLGFWNATPIVQPANTTAIDTLLVNTGLRATGGNANFATKITNALPQNLKGYTVASLPAGVQGDIAFVTNALAPAFLVAIAGGGAVVTPVFYDGTNWVSY